jgi:glycosyltransferase involved in cell wall biosynthesis
MPETVKAAVRQGAKIWSDQILNQSEEVSLRVMRHEKESGLSRSWQHDESLNKEIIGVSELVTVPSNYCLEGIKKFIAPRTQTHLIPYGADEGALGRPKIENIKEVVVLARASTIRKGGHLLLQALPLCGQRPVALSAPQRVRIVILGDLETELKEFLSRLSLPEGLVVEHGNIPHLLMPELYREASLFLMPSLSEGMSLACIEAMHARLPMILSPYCGIDGFEHGRMGYETMDTPGSLASAMVAAFENRALWPQWGMNAKHLAEKLSWSAYENAIGQLAEKVFC